MEGALMIQHLLRLLLTRTWLLLLLLLGALSSAWYGLSSSLSGMQRAPWVVVLIFGLLAGWLLARTRLRTLWAILLLAGLGILFPIIFFAKLGSPLLAMLRTSLLFGKDLWRWTATLPDPEPLFLAWQEIGTSLSVLFFHLNRWASAARQGQWIVNPIATSLLWSVVFWMAAGWAAWAVRRLRNPLAGLAPLGLLLAFLLNYTGGDIYSLLSFVGCLLLLMAITRLDANELRWLRQHTDYAADIGQDLGLTAGALTVAIVFLAGAASILPTATLDLIDDLTDRYRYGESGDDSIARSLGIAPRPKEVLAMSPWVRGGLPRQHLLGSGPELSQRVVMTVRVFGQVSGMAGSDTIAPRYYWRSLTYDQYNSQGWSSSFAKETPYSAGGRLLNVSNLPGNLVTIEFDPVEDLGGLLYTTGQLVSADHNYLLALRPFEATKDIPIQAQQNAAVDIFGARIEADPYQVEALVAIQAIKRLRTTGTAYPLWIRQRYLELPLNLPDRVISKALELTEDLTNPYDKAAAIEAYLRTIPYSLDIPAPPLGQDVVDTFLFEIQKGYCDYYATAMAVLARAAGLPSRLVVGYASGAYDPANNRYVVTEADAHSWVEIYFAGRGWVEFEPTTSLPLIERPEDQPELEQAQLPLSQTESQPPIDWQIVLNQAGLGAALLGAFALLIFQLDSLRLQRMPPEEAISRIYRRLYRGSRPLTGPLSPSTTPNEFVDTLGARVQAVGQVPLIRDILPSVPAAVHSLTRLYNRAQYSSHLPTRPEIKGALRSWRDLRWRLWLGRLAPKPRGKGIKIGDRG
jgi:transglutaminase-like putative cysteine protease